jgi:O-antigen/teichoic acid export membrane protein
MSDVRTSISLWRQVMTDRAALYSLGNTLRAVVCGPLTAYFIATRLSKEVQGFYYTFGSLLALQVFAELGLGAVITQFASHEWASLSLRTGRVEGVESSRSRLAGLLRFSLRWYAGASLTVLLPLAAFGLYFFQSAHADDISWKGPWLALCLVAATRVMLTPTFAILDGCGQVVQTYGFRLLDGLVTVASTWAAILLGFNLWTAAFVGVNSLLVALLFLGLRYRQFFGSLLAVEVREKIHWREEVLPMQWRIALSWLSGYFAFQLFIPVLFHFRGPREAGQFGLTWNMVSSINTIGSAFLQTKAPTFGALVAVRNFAELDRRAWRAMGLAILGTALGGVALLGLLHVLRVFYPSLAERCLGVTPTAILLAATVLMQISIAQSGYLRAFKREPFLVLSLLFAAATGGLTWWLGREFGATGVAWGYLAAVVFIVLPLGTGIFLRRRQEWLVATSESH